MAPPKNPAIIQVVEQTVIFLDDNVFGMIERMLERERPRMGLTRYRWFGILTKQHRRKRKITRTMRITLCAFILGHHNQPNNSPVFMTRCETSPLRLNMLEDLEVEVSPGI